MPQALNPSWSSADARLAKAALEGGDAPTADPPLGSPAGVFLG